MTVETTHPNVAAGQQSQSWAVAGHLSAFLMFFGVPAPIGPLVVWLIRRDDPYVERQAKEALNFNLSYLLYAIVAGVSVVLLVGLIALPVVFIAWFVLVISASVAASHGEDYRYPGILRFVA